jgi:hypothetical protein
MDRFCKICLVLIVLLLAINVFHPVLSPKPVHAAQTQDTESALSQLRAALSSKPVHAGQMQYEVVYWNEPYLPIREQDRSLIEGKLNEEAANGWELVAAMPLTDTLKSTYGYPVTLTESVLLIFRKP